MEQKTKVFAEDGKQDLQITRQFDLPIELLFKAYVKADLLEQWMGTKVIKLESVKHGSFQFETTDPKGNKLNFNGVIHEILTNQKIIRTFEMENMPFGVQLEIYEFQKLPENQSKLKQHIIYQSAEHRDENLKIPYRQGINWAHNRIEEILK
jgi:uncharacterized protein YndB with AHSA1/START domain